MQNTFTRADIEQNKLKAGLGYLVFFLPLILCRDSKLGRHCANQGLLLLILCILVSIAVSMLTGLPLIGWVFTLSGKIARFGLLLLALVCFLQLTSNNRAVEIPYIGGIKIIQ